MEVGISVGPAGAAAAVSEPGGSEPTTVPDGRLAGLTAPPTAWTAAAERDVTDLLGRVPAGGAPLRALGATASAAVAAVPDTWLADAETGARARERLHRVLSGGLGLPLREVVAHSVAVVAAAPGVGAADRPEHWLVCDVSVGAVGVSSVSAALCRREGQRIRRLAAAAATVPEPAPGTASGGRRHLLDVLRDARHAPQERARLALPRARHLPRYRQTPVYFPAATGGVQAPAAVVTAGEVLDAADPILAALQATAGRALLAAAPEQVVTPCLTGDLSFLPDLPEALSGAVAKAGAPAAPVTVCDDSAPARGAVAAAAGVVAVVEPWPAGLRLPVFAVRGGRHVTEHVPVAPSGDRGSLPAVSGPDGTPLVVEVVDGARPLVVELVSGPAPGAVTVSAPDASVVPGRYTVGFWPGLPGPGVLALRPVDGLEPLMYVLVELQSRQER